MSWLPPWLGAAYSALYMRHRTEPFRTGDATRALSVPPARSNLILSLLARAGWAVRLHRGVYRLLQPEARLALDRGSLDHEQRTLPYYPAFEIAVSEIFRGLAPHLLSIALYGSRARGTASPESDIDLLVIVEAGRANWDAIDPVLASVRKAAASYRPRGTPAEGDGWLVQPVVMDVTRLHTEPLLLLDLTEDARIVYDRDGTLEGTLAGMREKLRRRGAERIWFDPQAWMWDLDPTPGAKPIESL